MGIPALIDSKDRRGFTLIEIVISMGIIAFALVAILGLFPVAIGSATDSQRETQAALIARTIYTDLDTRTDTKRLLLTSPDADEEPGRPSTREVDLTTSSNTYLTYGFDGEPLEKINAAIYKAGDPKATFIADVDIRPQPASDGAGPDDVKELSCVAVSIEYPAAVPAERRKKYTFVSLFRQGIERQPATEQ